MISVSEALDQLFALVRPMPIERAPLTEAAGRTLAQPVTTQLTQPAFDASAMDGYAVCAPKPGAVLRVVGESAAGKRFKKGLQRTEAVRIFTGAPIPDGATHVILQEDITRDSDSIRLPETLDNTTHIRPAGNDFQAGMTLDAPRVLTFRDVALLAAMNQLDVPVFRKPEVALIATGDELVMPGETPAADQIVASNTLGLHAFLTQLGAFPRLLPIARDSAASLTTALTLAKDADLILTVGGASVGDHDLVASVTEAMGLQRAFHKVAMRPGKPLMSGRLGEAMLIGLPGNPVSALVCGCIFVAPVIRAMTSQGAAAAARRTAPLAIDLPPNGPREHYLRATLGPDGVTPHPRQDSSLLTVLAGADVLLVRPPHDAARTAGDIVEIIDL